MLTGFRMSLWWWKAIHIGGSGHLSKDVNEKEEVLGKAKERTIQNQSWGLGRGQAQWPDKWQEGPPRMQPDAEMRALEEMG